MKERGIDMAKYVDDDRILTCKTMREAIRLCVETSGKQIKEVAFDLGMPKENLYRMINSSDDPRHFPPEKLPLLMEVCGNEKPLLWLSLHQGYGLYRLPEVVEAECKDLREKLKEAEQRLTIFEEMCSRALRNKEA